MADNATSKVLTLKQELREAIKLAQELSDTPGPRLDAAIQRAGQLKDEISDVNEQIAIFSGGTGLEQAGSALGDIGSKLKNLDFEGAAKSAKALTDITKSITFGEATKGVKQLGSTFLNLGKALLTNPLFLIAAAIGAAVAAVVKLLDKMGVLKKLGELVGFVFEKIGEVVDFIADKIAIVVDLLFGTTLQLEKLAKIEAERNDKQVEKAKELGKVKSDGFQREINEAKALGKNTDELEIKKREAIELTARIEYLNFKNKLNNANFLKGLNADEIKELRKNANEAKTVLLNAQSDLRTEKNNQTKQDEDDAKKADEKRKSDNEKNEAKRKENAANRLAAARQARDLELSLEEEGLQKSLDINAEKYKRLIEDTQRDEKKNAEEKKKIIGFLEQQQIQESEKLKNDDNDKKLELEQKYQDALKDLNKIQADTETERINQEFKEKEDALKKEYTDEVKQKELLEALEKQHQEELSKIKEDEKKRNNEALLQLDTTSLEDKKAILEQQKNAELENKNLTDTEKLLIEQNYKESVKTLEDEEVANKKKVEDAKLGLVSQGFSLITDVANIFAGDSEKAAKRAFDINKAVGIAQTIISTYQAAQAAYASQLAITSPDAPVRAAIAAGFAVASGLAKVAAIARTKFDSKSTPSASSTSSTPSTSAGTTPATPSVSFFGQGNNSNTVGPGSLQQANVQQQVNINSVVSVSEINEVQNTVRVQDQRRSL